VADVLEEPVGGPDRPADLVSPISKALFVLDRVAEHSDPMRFADLQRVCGFPKATLHRLLRQLEHEGMLIQDPKSQRYRLGMRLIRLAHAAWESASLAQIAQPFLDNLSTDLGMTVHLACLENGQVLYLDKKNASNSVQMFSRPGRIGPAYCTGVGKAMLAFLPQDDLERALDRQAFHQHTPKTLTTRDALCADLTRIRERGYSFDDEEHEPAIICLAVPIRSHQGGVIGGLSITTTTHVSDLARLETLAPQLIDTARDIAREAEPQLISA